MTTFTTQAIVLKNAEYSDYDRMVTLFSPEYGKMDAIARGCRRPKSPLMNCAEPFTSGDYTLFSKNERYSIEQCRISESFYDLRTDYDSLVHGVYWLRLLDAVIMPEVAAPKLFLTTLHALAHLCYTDLPRKMLTMAFEMHLMADVGMMPQMNRCARCGCPIDGDARFDIDAGSTVCLKCPSASPRIKNGARRILMKLPRTSYDKVPLLDGHPDWEDAARLYRLYINAKLHTEKFAPLL